MAEFDQFADDYQRVLDDSVRLSGEDAEFFALHKVGELRRLPGAPPRRILDYGCGVGTVTRHLARGFPDATIDGFDPSEESLAEIPDPVRARGTFAGDLAALGADYDLVVVSNVLHHIRPSDRPAVMADLGGRVAPGGRIAVFEHNPLNPLTRWVVAHCPFDDDAILLWPSETLELLGAAGLVRPRRKYVLFFPAALAALRPLEPRLAWLPLGAQYLAWGSR